MCTHFVMCIMTCFFLSRFQAGWFRLRRREVNRPGQQQQQEQPQPAAGNAEQAAPHAQEGVSLSWVDTLKT